MREKDLIWIGNYYLDIKYKRYKIYNIKISLQNRIIMQSVQIASTFLTSLFKENRSNVFS